MSRHKIIKVGNSLGITLPFRLVKNLSLKIGDRVDLSTNTENSIIVTFPDSTQLTLGLPPAQNNRKLL